MKNLTVSVSPYHRTFHKKVNYSVQSWKERYRLVYTYLFLETLDPTIYIFRSIRKSTITFSIHKIK
jgi:hypothetical protein